MRTWQQQSPAIDTTPAVRKSCPGRKTTGRDSRKVAGAEQRQECFKDKASNNIQNPKFSARTEQLFKSQQKHLNTCQGLLAVPVAQVEVKNSCGTGVCRSVQRCPVFSLISVHTHRSPLFRLADLDRERVGARVHWLVCKSFDDLHQTKGSYREPDELVDLACRGTQKRQG